MGVIHKIGRRKCAVARVYVTEGTGKITVNKKEFATYFPTATLQYKVLQPMSMTENVNNFDVKVNVYGGLSFAHITQPKDNFTADGGKLPIRTTFHV
ncbi:MAG: 30S ribosomal protein S9, partial [Flavobacterium sp.]